MLKVSENCVKNDQIIFLFRLSYFMKIKRGYFTGSGIKSPPWPLRAFWRVIGIQKIRAVIFFVNVNKRKLLKTLKRSGRGVEMKGNGMKE